MARRKRPVALFEVIHKDKRFAPKPVAPLQRPVVAASKPAVAAAVARAPVSAPSVPRQPPLVRSRSRISRRIVAERASAWWQNLRSAAAPRLDWLRQKLEPHYPVLAGAACALAIIGIISLARHLAHRSESAEPGLASLQQIRQQGIHPQVMEVAVQTHPLAPVPDPTNEPSATPSDALAQAADSVLPPAPREVNLNYVLVQSYGDQKTASEACDFLNHNGIPCTIERGVKNWRKDFYLVIGLQGFTRVSGPDYLAYRSRIEALSAQFAAPHSYYKGFAPQPIKWDRAN
jgi:hypothetical protein